MGSNHDTDVSSKIRTAYRTCPLCEATCGLELTIEGDAVKRIRGDRRDVFSGGYLCAKGAALDQIDGDPDRLKAPMIRDGKTWREVSWDQAFDHIEQSMTPILDTYGRDAVGVYLGNPNTHTIAGNVYIRPLLKMLRSRNIYSSSTVDQMPKQASSGLLFGSAATIPVPDIDRTDYLLMLGANPWESNGSLCTAPNFSGRIRALQARGGKFTVVDPCRTRTAKAADEYLPIKPGTDPYFLFGIVHTLFEEGLVAPGDLADHLTGLEDLHEAARPFSPESVESSCLIEANTIRRIARELGAAPRAVVYGRMGTCTVMFGTITSWLVDVINILTGNMDRPGGAMFPEPAHARAKTTPGGKGFSMGRWHSRVKEAPEVCGELPVSTLADEIETPGEGRIRAMITVASNPALTAPNSDRINEAFSSLDFMVSIDPYLNETTRHAHVILPPEPRLAQGQYDFTFYGLSVRNVAHYSPPVFNAEPGRLKEWEILLRLASVVGGQGSGIASQSLDDLVIGRLVATATKDPSSSVAGRDQVELMDALSGRRGPERILDFMIRTGAYGDGFGSNPDGLSMDSLEANPHGIDLGPLKPRIPQVLRTRSAKIELTPRPILEELPRLAEYMTAGSEADLRLVGRRRLRSCNSWGHNIASLVTGKDCCTLLIHREDADRLGLTDGGMALVSSRVGNVQAPVEITDDIMPGVVSLPYGWGHNVEGISLTVASARPGLNSNVLTDDLPIDRLSGTSVLNGIPVEVTPGPTS